MPRTNRIKDHQFEQRFFLQRSLVAAFIIAGFTVLLFGRLVMLQIVRYDHYLELAQSNRARKDPIPANRGLIYDRNGNVLAETQASWQLELMREQVEKVARLEDVLQGLVAINVLAQEDLVDVRKLIKARRSFEWVPIRLRLTQDERDRFDVHKHEFPGVDIQFRSARFYPHGALAVHALGYVGAIDDKDIGKIDPDAYVGTNLIGKMGVEKARETELHGFNGYREILVNAQGRSVELKDGIGSTLREEPQKAGSDLILSLDLAAQQAAEEGFNGRRGAAVAIDPHNGDVLVLASMPGFDPSMYGRGITRKELAVLNDSQGDRPLLNRALAGTYPAGSTVKPVLGMAGLAYGEITPDHTHYCSGEFRLPGVSKPWREGRGGVHGTVDVRTAIAESCDVYFYWLSDQLQVDRMHDFMAPFGYGRKTGIDIPGEVAGVLPSKEYKKNRFKNPSEGMWYGGDTINFGIGQGFMLVTPLQVAQVSAVLAAKGAVFQPRLVTGIRDPSGKVTKIEPVAMPHVKGGTPEQWDVVMEGMRATVTRGTARGIETKEYTIAGKTGTAQAYSVKANQRLDRAVDEKLKDHSWFMAFAPAEDPQIAVAVLVENGGFGASAAAPIARKIFDAYLLPRLKKTAAETPAKKDEPEEKPAASPEMGEPEPGGESDP